MKLMSMPEFPDADTVLSKEEAINAIITSIALEETALSHIMNAEGEKIQYALAYATSNTTQCSLEQLLEVNASVASILDQISDMQLLLKNKLRIAKSYLPPEDRKPSCPPANPVNPCWPHPPSTHPPCAPHHKPPCPCKCKDYPCSGCDGCPPHVCKCPCTTVLEAVTEYAWHPCTTLRLQKHSCCENGIQLTRSNCETQVILPAGKHYKIELALDLANKHQSPICLELELRCGDARIAVKEYTCTSEKYHVRFEDVLCWQTPRRREDSIFTIRLLSNPCLDITRGRILITEI